jgi:protein TonB
LDGDQPGQARAHGSLWDEPRTKVRRGRVEAAIALSIVVHAALGYAVYKVRFAADFQIVDDPVIEAQIVPSPVLLPPPPSRPIEERTKAPPPPTQPLPVREAVLPAPSPLTPTLTIAQVGPQSLTLTGGAGSFTGGSGFVAGPPSLPLIRNPEWASLPSQEQIDALYPARAGRRRIPADVILLCQVLAEGVVVGCRVETESPAGLGFGEAALKMTPMFRIRPKLVDGQAVDRALVRVPIGFSMR